MITFVSAEVWFERRKNYTLSHAVMSMVGYILALQLQRCFRGSGTASPVLLTFKIGKMCISEIATTFGAYISKSKRDRSMNVGLF